MILKFLKNRFVKEIKSHNLDSLIESPTASCDNISYENPLGHDIVNKIQSVFSDAGYYDQSASLNAGDKDEFNSLLKGVISMYSSKSKEDELLKYLSSDISVANIVKDKKDSSTLQTTYLTLNSIILGPVVLIKTAEDLNINLRNIFSIINIDISSFRSIYYSVFLLLFINAIKENSSIKIQVSNIDQLIEDLVSTIMREYGFHDKKLLAKYSQAVKSILVKSEMVDLDNYINISKKLLDIAFDSNENEDDGLKYPYILSKISLRHSKIEYLILMSKNFPIVKNFLGEPSSDLFLDRLEDNATKFVDMLNDNEHFYKIIIINKSIELFKTFYSSFLDTMEYNLAAGLFGSAVPVVLESINDDGPSLDHLINTIKSLNIRGPKINIFIVITDPNNGVEEFIRDFMSRYKNNGGIRLIFVLNKEPFFSFREDDYTFYADIIFDNTRSEVRGNNGLFSSLNNMVKFEEMNSLTNAYKLSNKDYFGYISRGLSEHLEDHPPLNYYANLEHYNLNLLNTDRDPNDIINNFARALSNKVPINLVFKGPKGSGRKSFAYYLARELNMCLLDAKLLGPDNLIKTDKNNMLLVNGRNIPSRSIIMLDDDNWGIMGNIFYNPIFGRILYLSRTQGYNTIFIIDDKNFAHYPTQNISFPLVNFGYIKEEKMREAVESIMESVPTIDYKSIEAGSLDIINKEKITLEDLHMARQKAFIRGTKLSLDIILDLRNMSRVRGENGTSRIPISVINKHQDIEDDYDNSDDNDDE